ncbi:hypothetical protein J437_LFUL017004 [Ladona fulva]|uniref:Uncharacterized protein n=1 Tax=Ladona fulva TaxID=123851 RepID=A0A8K0KMQ4_LADFU|nr:hypothetical protein J437_LFUL017004 [Ladona fulva]
MEGDPFISRFILLVLIGCCFFIGYCMNIQFWKLTLFCCLNYVLNDFEGLMIVTHEAVFTFFHITKSAQIPFSY